LFRNGKSPALKRANWRNQSAHASQFVICIFHFSFCNSLCNSHFAIPSIPSPLSFCNSLARLGISLLLLFALLAVPDAAPGLIFTPGPDSAAGTWYLNANDSRLTLLLGGPSGTFGDWAIDQDGKTGVVDHITWDPAAHLIEFRRNRQGLSEWYRATISEGILAGRFSSSADSADKPALAQYKYHVTGWNTTHLDRALTPRVYDILISNNSRAILRIDSSPDSPTGYAGRLKVYSTVSGAAAGEELESDLEVTQWDGVHLTFVRHDQNPAQTYSATISGRTISGTLTQAGAPPSQWSGVRAQVLTYGFGAPRDPEERAAWQGRTRLQLCHLMMADNPAPLTHKATVLASHVMPIGPVPYPPERDDNPAGWPQQYRLTELRFDYALPNPYGGSPLARSSHAYLAVPASAPQAGGKYPAVLAVNGHGGSAWKMMNGTDRHYWYGDGFARRGFVVLALDISHRPLGDRAAPYMSAPLYTNELNGDDPAHGNGLHPAIKADGFDSDWEESGERVWDAMRALDYLLAQPNVDPNRVLVTGLSMGGEVTTITSALDRRVTMSIPAAFSPDMNVVRHHGNHSCWQWLHADLGEYIDTSDLFALIAPRPLIIQTGKVDPTYSSFRIPFAADKQVVRRARMAYGGEAGNLVHYLHYDQHNYHAGDVNPTHSSERGVRIPAVIEPTGRWSSGWQTDDRTYALKGTLFDLVSFFLGRE
jgi:dienelactone hydrolase